MAKHSLNFDKYVDTLPCEDRSFGGNTFYVDLVPSSLWYQNLRAMMPRSQWNILRQYVITRANNQCEICQSTTKLEAHERWHFDDTSNTQKLARIMCLCKTCHLATHIGLAQTLGYYEPIVEHICTITGWSKTDFETHVKECTAQWKERSLISWKIDVNVVANLGITIHDPDTTQANIKKKKIVVNKEAENTYIQLDHRNFDLTDQLRERWIVISAREQADILGGIPLTDDFSVIYVTKPPTETREDVPWISLSIFIKAHKNPININQKSDLEGALRDCSIPTRFIIETDWIDDDLISECLKRGILFSV